MAVHSKQNKEANGTEGDTDTTQSKQARVIRTVQEGLQRLSWVIRTGISGKMTFKPLKI